ncbi:MAG: formate--phosphoribosylaminoimidazolecarboxamide ligase family protein [Theionarchaea archaeon]|nr:formate--phosphoribosylaminoimidazolecarboxamide ligase family protein [Theionarchaea archaeon]MBU7000150.1 formate--phosphoribosylaminoimidazolecarboxamide ligase family protein [Theionarchaea archaeon]MBU7020867.1 formate--phosphoribosylaminoimidazolecarboxamide ligase family protein [Theionarchaea archaeon]MBU7033896.1 formate--phosphoribosylaminoimidazolecarboxamide ligase family protein [Theionarchaea archaeon]MBU7039191.1 formate--phosphoribosylaminoimidazolecarboxamide ligase family p
MRSRVQALAKTYDPDNVHIGVLGSHSALEVGYGAREEGFKTVVVCQKGREKTYTKRFRNLFDEVILLEKFSHISSPDTVEKLKNLNTIFVPNRSFSVYCGYDNIETTFEVPLFGARQMLRAEERDVPKNQYYLMEKSGVPFPRIIETPNHIDRLVMVKLSQAKKRVERGFFTCASFEEYTRKSEDLIKKGLILKEDLEKAVIEEFVVGALFNLDYFYSPLHDDIEFMGADQRIETDIEGVLHMTAEEQKAFSRTPTVIPIGHRGLTVRESQLDTVFELGEKFAKTCKQEYPPGIFGCFALQGVFDRDLKFYTFDVSLRVPGAPILLTSSPYTMYKYGVQMSVGRRIAMEIREAVDAGRLSDCVT